MFLLTTRSGSREAKVVYRHREHAIAAAEQFVGTDRLGYGKPQVRDGKIWTSSRFDGFLDRLATIEPVTFFGD